MVLLVAALSVRGRRAVSNGPPAPAEPEAVLLSLAHLLAPVFVLVAGYLVWTGSRAPGGAFQAGAVLSGGGVLLLLSRQLSPPDLGSFRARALLLGGPFLFVLIAGAQLPFGGPMLAYPTEHAGALLLCLEVFLAAFLGLSLLTVFSGLTHSAGQRTERSTQEPP